jgi:uncharacterized protein with HEPN domain
LGIIGEAVNKFEKLFPESPLENAGKITGFRNRLIHAYDSMDQSIIYKLYSKNLILLNKFKLI